MLYIIKGQKKEDGTVTHWKENEQTHKAKEVCLQTCSCTRLALNCPLFPLTDSEGKLSGICSERLKDTYPK